MLPKLLIMPFFILSAFFAKSQVNQTDTVNTSTEAIHKDIHMHEAGYPVQTEDVLSMVKEPTNLKDTSHGNIHITFKCAPSLTSTQYPLVIIGGKNFKGRYFNDIFFDLSEISNINVINPKNDSIKLYGRAGRYGVMIFYTKYKIEWITSNAIRRRYFKSLFFWHKRAAFQINGSIINPAPNVYIQKDLIRSIKVNSNGFDVYGKKEYQRIINVKVDKVSWPIHMTY